MKKVVSKLLVIMLVMTMIVPTSTVSAATKLSAKKASVTVGGAKTIWLYGNTKKVKWSVSNSKIKITKKTKTYARIKGMSSGTATLKAKIGGKTYKCNIKVKAANTSATTNVSNFDSKKAEQSIVHNVKIVNGKIVDFIESGYSEDVHVSAKCNFYDSDGNAVDYSSDTISNLGKGDVGMLDFYLPNVNYSYYEITYEYSESYWSDMTSCLSVSAKAYKDNFWDYIMLTLTNSSKYECDYASVGVIYYDSAGNIVAVDSASMSVDANATSTEKIYQPYSSTTYEDIQYSTYEVFIEYAYRY